MSCIQKGAYLLRQFALERVAKCGEGLIKDYVCV